MCKIGVSLAAAATLLSPVLSSAAAPPEATTFRITVDHTAVTSSGGVLALQQKPLWIAYFNGRISYPVIANGTVFVTTSDTQTYGAGTHLYALDSRTAATRWDVALPGVSWPWAAPAYDAGKVFTIDDGGVLRSFDAQTGAAGWTVALGTASSFMPPIAANGVVYASGNGVLAAYAEADGTQHWTRPVMGGDASPALGPAAVYAGYPCPNVYAFGLDGTPLWSYPQPMSCIGGGADNTAYANGRLYVANNPTEYVLDAVHGTLLGSYSSGGATPAVSSSGLYYVQQTVLHALDLNLNPTWSFNGDGSLVSAPVVIDQTVIVGGNSGMLYGLNASNGNVTWQVNSGLDPIPDPDVPLGWPPTGLAAADGILVVPKTTQLVAYAILGPPAPTALIATGAAGAINLSWTAPPGSATYNVYMGTSSNTEAVIPLLSGVTPTSATVPVQVIPAQNYFFQVKAVSGAGISAPSNEAFASAHTPAPPAGLTATAGIGSVQLSWTASAEAQSYDIYSGTSATPLESGVTTTSAMFSGLSSGSPLFYTVRSVAYGTVGGPSNQVMVTPLPVPPPTNLKATAGNASVTLTWSAASGASSYSLYMGTSTGGEAAQPVQSGISKTTATVSGLSNGSAYYFVVRAAGPAGTSQASSEVAATPAAPPPPASGGSGGGGGGGGWDWLSVALLASLAGLRARRSTRT